MAGEGEPFKDCKKDLVKNVPDIQGPEKGFLLW